MKIFVPADFYLMTDGQAHQHLVKASIGALRDAGFEPRSHAGDQIGWWVKNYGSTDRRELVRGLETWLNEQVEEARR